MMEYVQRELPYVRSFVLRSVYGVLRQEGITFGEEEPGRVIAEWREDGTDVSLSITADYKLLPATEAIGEDYESGYIAYPPDVMEKLLALDGY